MDPIRRLHRPELRSPRAIVAFEGWNDACEAASGAAGYVAGQGSMEPFSLIEPEEFFDFREARPVVSVAEGGTRSLEWPFVRFYAVETGGAHDLVVVLGDEPHLRWKSFVRRVGQVLADADVDLVVTLGSFIGQVAHSAPVPVFGIATDPALLEPHGLEPSNYEGPSGIVGVLLEALRETGIPALSLWAATPHYLAANSNPPAMLALLKAAAPILDVPLDVAELETAAAEFVARVDEALEDNDDLATYVQRLAAAGPGTQPLDPGESDLLITEIEQFLRNRDR